MEQRGRPGHTPEHRKMALERTMANGNVSRTCRELGLARSVLSRWIREHRLKGGAGLRFRTGRPPGPRAAAAAAPPREDLDLLRRKIGEQQVMIDFLSEACRRVGARRAPSSGGGGKGCTPPWPR